MNNYCLRRLRYAFNFTDVQLVEIFACANFKLLAKELKSYVVKDDHPEFVALPDYLLVVFLDGLIIKKRGRREGQLEISQAERVEQSKRVKLNNNLIVNKIKIALSLNTEDLIEILGKADFRISKSEISAFFRNPTHRNYRECGNQFLRNLLTGITTHYQVASGAKVKSDSTKNHSKLSKPKSLSKTKLVAKNKPKVNAKSTAKPKPKPKPKSKPKPQERTKSKPST